MRLHRQRNVNQSKIGGVLDTGRCLCSHPLVAGWLCCARDAERVASHTDIFRHRAPTKVDGRQLVPVFIQHRPSDKKYHQDRCHFSSVESSPKMTNRQYYPNTYPNTGWQQEIPIHNPDEDEANRPYYPPSGWQQEVPIPNYNVDEGYGQGESSRGFQSKLILVFIIPFKELATRLDSLNMQFR